MSNKLFTMILSIALVAIPFCSKGNDLQTHMNLLYTNMNDSEVLDEFKDFAERMFNIESESQDLYDFLVEFLTKDLEEGSEFSELNEKQ